ncbi:FAD-dependent thymidylate synthase [Candidatus Uhrbacteria bacterium]|nr:FAD-dependent thymidylate synthase [Candidatus Uhrbacteria bacterium]
MPKFTDEERKRLEPYVTDTESDVFAVRGLDGVVGAVFARYSRASTGFRETLLKEFVDEGQIDAKKAADLIERVLIAFGDDSVGELEGAHLSFENISVLATKEIEDRRIGGSPIEKSTRYVLYDQKDDGGQYRYYRDPDIMASPLAKDYTTTMDFVFDTYSRLVEPMQQYYRGLKPMEEAEYDINGDGVKEKMSVLKEENDIKAFKITYRMDIRTKACDTLRYLLPLSTLTNVGIFGNGRFFQNMVSCLWTSDLPEANRLGDASKAQLDQVIPRYVKRACRNEYLATVRRNMGLLADRMLTGIEPEETDRISLVDRSEADMATYLSKTPVSVDSVRKALTAAEDDMILAQALYPHARLPLTTLRGFVRRLSGEDRREIIRTYVGERQTRRDRPGRAFEAGYAWTFDCLTDFGTYKDIMRHRMTTQMRQRFTPLLGFEMPDDLAKAGFSAEAEACVARASELYRLLESDFPAAAAYATLHGSKVRWLIGMNDREAHHMIELRTTPQGHVSYRRACQEMHRLIRNRSPWRSDVLRFADHNDYFWSRADSEARQRSEERQLEKKSEKT